VRLAWDGGRRCYAVPLKQKNWTGVFVNKASILEIPPNFTTARIGLLPRLQGKISTIPIETRTLAASGLLDTSSSRSTGLSMYGQEPPCYCDRDDRDDRDVVHTLSAPRSALSTAMAGSCVEPWLVEMLERITRIRAI
jgi:hypothetical protein